MTPVIGAAVGPAAPLWSEAERALLLGDVYLLAQPELHDEAMAIGVELAELAERVEAEPRGAEADVAEVLARAEATLATLAPRG